MYPNPKDALPLLLLITASPKFSIVSLFLEVCVNCVHATYMTGVTVAPLEIQGLVPYIDPWLQTQRVLTSTYYQVIADPGAV